MPRACCVPKCRTGHRRRKNELRPISTGSKPPSLHLFPRDKAIRELWRDSIPFYRSNPGDHTYVCSLHFQESDYVAAPSTDDRKISLKKGAIPSVFTELLQLQTEQHDDENVLHSINEAQEDKVVGSLIEVQSLEDLSDVLDLNRIPSGISYLLRPERELIFLMVDDLDDTSKSPALKFSLRIDYSLQFDIWCNQLPLDKSQVEHIIIPSDKIRNVDQVTHLLEFLKSFSMSSEAIDRVQQGISLIMEGTWHLSEAKRQSIVSLLQQVKDEASSSTSHL